MADIKQRVMLGLGTTNNEGFPYLPIVNGRLIVNTDENEFFIDIKDKRIAVSDIITLDTEKELLELQHPANKLYVSLHPFCMYKYIDGEWCKLGGDGNVTYKVDPKHYLYTVPSTLPTSYTIPASVYNTSTDHLVIYYKGLRLIEGENYTLDGNTVVPNFTMVPGEIFNNIVLRVAKAEITESVTVDKFIQNMKYVKSQYVYNPASADDNVYTLPSDQYSPTVDTVELYKNGNILIENVDYTILDGKVTMLTPVAENDNLVHVISGFRSYLESEDKNPTTIMVEDSFTSSSRTNALSAYRGRLLYEMVTRGYDYLRSIKGFRTESESLLDMSNSTIFDNMSNRKVADRSTNIDEDGTYEIVTNFYDEAGNEIAYSRRETITYNEDTGKYITIVS